MVGHIASSMSGSSCFGDTAFDAHQARTLQVKLFTIDSRNKIITTIVGRFLIADQWRHSLSQMFYLHIEVVLLKQKCEFTEEIKLSNEQ